MLNQILKWFGLIMYDKHKGVIHDVGDNSCVVVYNINGKLLEQVYEPDQFVDGKLPNVGDKITAVVYVWRTR